MSTIDDDFNQYQVKNFNEYKSKLFEDLSKGIGFTSFCSYANELSANMKRMFIILHKYGMLKYNPKLNGYQTFNPIISTKDESELLQISKASLYLDISAGMGVSTLLSCFLKMKIFSEGPKVFSLSTEKCEALENTLLTVPSEEYQQPFPVVVVDFSSDYISNRLVPFTEIESGSEINNDEVKKTSIDASSLQIRLNEGVCEISEMENIYHKPSFATIYHSPENKILSMAITMSSGIDLTAIINLKEGDSLDDCFDRDMSKKSSSIELDLTEGEVSLCKKIFRTLCNLCMLACDFGCNSIPDPYREKLLKKNNKKYKDINEFNVLTRPVIYELNQKIKLYEKKSVRIIDSESTGKDVKPHWRRGHWRMQPYGEKNSLRKRIHIPAVFVNFSEFGGDLSNTITNYNL